MSFVGEAAVWIFLIISVFMVLFGAGTSAALMLLGNSVALIKVKLRARLYKLSGVFVMSMGIVFTFKAAKMLLMH